MSPPRHCIGFLVLLGLVAIPGDAAAETAPERLARERGEAFVEAMSSGSGEALEAFAREHLESRLLREGLTARLTQTLLADRAELGGIERHSIRVLEEGALVFVYCKRSTSGAWFNYQFRVLPDDGHRLQLVFRAIAMEPMEVPALPIRDPAAVEWLGRFVQALETQHPFSGVAVVQQRDRDVYSLVQGMADVAERLPITRASRFGMASGSKLFTAVAILQLVQDGKLALDDTLAEHLPTFPDAEFARRATIHQLLSHTAGAGDYWDDEYERHWSHITEHSQMLPHVLRHLGESPPGEYRYSNSGYILLGLVIEAVTGQSFYDHVQRRILGPAGMTSTGYPKRLEQPPGSALPYDPEMEAGAVKLGSWLPAQLGERGTAAGGASATADDLLHFVEALRTGRLLDAAHLELLTRPHVEIGADRWYGYGTMIQRRNGVVSWGHGGSAPGTQFELEVLPASDTVMVVLSNYNTIAGVELASALDRLVRNEPAP